LNKLEEMQSQYVEHRDRLEEALMVLVKPED
jgi:hypothetical protein